MYASAIQDIENPILRDAAWVLSIRKGNPFKFRSIYMDKNGECAISYYGKLSEFQIKEIMINFCYPMEDKSFNEIHPIYLQDYTYDNGHHANGESAFTTIYTPDGLDYRTLKI